MDGCILSTKIALNRPHYNGLGQRVSQTVSAVLTEYLLDVQPGLYKVIAATASGSTDRFIHDPMGIAQHEDNSGNWHWMAKDGLGTVRGVYDDTLSEVYAADRDPYGGLIAGAGSNPTPFEYTGEPEDQNGLLHLRARYYDPNLAVFNSLDPVEGVLQVPQSLNGYGYVHGNPINFTDLIGLGPFDCILGRDEATGRCKGHEIVDVISGAVPQEPIADLATGYIQLESEILEAITLGHIDHESSQQFAASVLQRADQVVNFVEAHPVELSAGAILIGVTIWAAAPAAAGGAAFGTSVKAAIVGGSTNLLGGVISGRYSETDSNEELFGKVGVDATIGAAGGYLFGSIPGLNSLVNVSGYSPLRAITERAIAFGAVNALQGAVTNAVDYIAFKEYDSTGDFAASYWRDVASNFILGVGVSVFTDTVVASVVPYLVNSLPGTYGTPQNPYLGKTKFSMPVRAFFIDQFYNTLYGALLVNLTGTNVLGPTLLKDLADQLISNWLIDQISEVTPDLQIGSANTAPSLIC